MRPLRRSRRDRLVAGIAGGLADWAGVPVLLVRFAWLALPGLLPALLLYLVCWLLVPLEPRRKDG